jgi:hypothetical protein
MAILSSTVGVHIVNRITDYSRGKPVITCEITPLRIVIPPMNNNCKTGNRST